MLNKKIIIALGIMIPAIGSCYHRTEPDGACIQKIPVKILTVKYSQDSAQNYYVGVVEESKSIPLSFLTVGTVDQVLFDEGQHVGKGNLLASLNSYSYQSALQVAAAKEKQAKDAYDRLSAVYQNGSLPQIKMVEMETGLEQASAAVQIADKNLRDCRLYAPIKGIIGKRYAEPGMNVIPGTPVFSIVQIEKVFIRVSVPENEIANTRPGQDALIHVPALNNTSFHGKIEQKGVMANLLSHTYDIKIAVSNKEEILRPGMVCNVLIRESRPAGSLTIPQHTVMTDPDGKNFVFTVSAKTGLVVRKNIVTGPLSGSGNIMVATGLGEGDQLVIEGYQKINSGIPVQIVR